MIRNSGWFHAHEIFRLAGVKVVDLDDGGVEARRNEADVDVLEPEAVLPLLRRVAERLRQPVRHVQQMPVDVRREEHCRCVLPRHESAQKAY